MLSQRDRKILSYLQHFRVLSRDQLGQLVCPEVARPWATINRIMKRLDRDGFVTTVPRPKDECYLNMQNPTIIHTESSKIRHYLAIADLYIRLGKPPIYEIEPQVDPEYVPDVYTRLHEPIIVEIQRSYISHKKMQSKVDGFVRTFKLGKHDARTLWIVTDLDFKVSVPEGFKVEKVALTPKVEAG